MNLHRQKKSWVGICGSGDRRGLCEKLGWHEREGMLLTLHILILDSMHRHMHGATRLHWGGLLAGRFQSPVLVHTDFTSCQQPLPIPQTLLFSLLLFHYSLREGCSVRNESALWETYITELWRGAEQKSLQWRHWKNTCIFTCAVKKRQKKTPKNNTHTPTHYNYEKIHVQASWAYLFELDLAEVCGWPSLTPITLSEDLIVQFSQQPKIKESSASGF